MAGGDISAWRKQNSDLVKIVVLMANGSNLRGSLLLPRDKTIAQLFNMPDPFIEFECATNGDMLLAKSAIVSLRRHEVPNADQLDKKTTLLDKADPHRILGVGKSATRDEIHAAYLALARVYHPDRFAAIAMPPEVSEYLEAMTRRINVAFSVLVPSVRKEDMKEERRKPTDTTEAA